MLFTSRKPDDSKSDERREEIIEELKAKFDQLSEDEKIDFLKMIIPSVCRLFSKNPQKIMQEMMPFCQEVMKMYNVDMSQFMGMMMKGK